MDRQTAVHCVLVAAVAAAGWGAVPCLATEEFRSSDTKSFVVGTQPDIAIETINGDISYVVTEGTTATVTIETIVRADNAEEAERIRQKIRLTVEGDEGFLTARVDYPDDFHRWLREIFGTQRSITVSFHVRGPKGADGVLGSVSGDVDAEGVLGHLEMRSVSGDIDARRLGGRLRINSTSGDVHITAAGASTSIRTVSGDQWIQTCAGDLEANSVSGNVEAHAVRGMTEVGTVSGDVTLDGLEATVRVGTTSGEIRIVQESGGFDLHSTSGDITIESSAPEEPLIVRSTSGEVSVSVRPESIGQAVLETSSGDIQADLEMTVRQHTRHRLVGRVGPGDQEIRISTVSGDIVLGEL
ncbi:MAG: DUF4097 family beta strand repeat-containing protein [Candidatus Zixiibacteriota bacterium]